MSRNQEDSDEGGTLSRLARTAELFRRTKVPDQQYRPGEHDPIVQDVEFTDRVVEQYWLNPPFAYVVITYDDQQDKHLYRVIEPSMDRFETDLIESLYDEIGRAHV